MSPVSDLIVLPPTVAELPAGMVAVAPVLLPNSSVVKPTVTAPSVFVIVL